MQLRKLFILSEQTSDVSQHNVFIYNFNMSILERVEQMDGNVTRVHINIKQQTIL
jgi:hypothetical protein